MSDRTSLHTRIRTAWHFMRDGHYPTAMDNGYLCEGCGLWFPYFHDRQDALGRRKATSSHPHRSQDD